MSNIRILNPRAGLWALALAVALLVGLAACSRAPAPSGPAGPALPRPMPAIAPAPAPRAEVSLAGLPSGAQRLIVRSAQVSLLVERVTETLDGVSGLAATLGGFVVSSSRQGKGEDASATITIRVPAEKFEEALRALRQLAVRVTSETTSSQDVTEEYVDLEARLRNLEATEGQFLELLKRANTVEEALKVHQALSNVRQEIERIKGRKQYLERTAAMSLITVNLAPAASPQPLVRPGWSPLEIAKEAVRGLTSLAQALAGLGIWLAVLSPIWVPLGVLLYWGYRRRASVTGIAKGDSKGGES